MQYLKRFFAFLFSLRMLAFLAVLLLALVIWFVGPLLAVDGLRPLASAGARVTVVVLLLVATILWLVSKPLHLVGVPALCLLIWHAGPLLSLGSAKPLAPSWVRVATIAALVSIYAIYGLYQLWRTLRDNGRFRDRFLSLDKEGGEQAGSKTNLKNVTDKVRLAMDRLRSLRMRGGMLRRVVEGKRYLYELPWYLIVGSQGAGKTTALMNAGLRFPLADQADPQGETTDCDWWFTNEAVWIDTAGRYISHTSEPGQASSEWHGFLGLLRKHRTQAPVNGVIVALNAAELLTADDVGRAAHAVRVRERLADLRQELGIRFPVYVVVTKMDLVRGFKDYFQSLTSEGRTQVWGFTLPHQLPKGDKGRAVADGQAALRARIDDELSLLRDRLAAGLCTRLSEEFDVDRRRRLFALPQEFAGLSVPLAQVIDEMFLDSRFDATQRQHTLRGIYFTSAAQAEVDLPADPQTVLQRLWRTVPPTAGHGAPPGRPPDDAPVLEAASIGNEPTASRQGFFLQNLLTQVIVPEAHLVQPNLRWEFRFRLLRWMGHLLVLVIFAWLAGALALSFGNNRRYLQTVGERAQALTGELRSSFADFKPAGVPDVLNGARELPGYAGLDVADPSSGFLYGLYAVPPILDAATETYAQLQDHLLLPPILRRMETVLADSIQAQDARTAYETLRVYRLLHDKARYMQDDAARDVRNWVLKDWEANDSAAAFGGRASMVGHVERLFSGARPVQSDSLPNEALVREAQAFLDGNTSTQRIYERAKAAMRSEAPQAFTLVRAIGPQAGTVFSRVGGLPLEKGVPGLFTYDGYHELFNRRLPEFVGRALLDDAWVMGRGTAAPASKASTVDRGENDPLLDDIRRQYLTEYAQHWEDFLASVRTVGGGDATGTGLGFDLSVLRQFAAPDSPLARLGRAAARETTLSRPLAARVQEDKGFLDKATDALDKGTRELGRTLGIRREERLEKELVDNRFAALREVVTGQADVALGPSTGVGAAKPGLEAISGLVNEFYTLLVVADTALTAGSLPPGGAEVGARLKLEAGKLPAPFREVLGALAVSGGDKVVRGAADILRKQAQLQLDRIMGLLALHVSEPCKRGVEGRYPLADVAQDASVEDFTLVFAVGGAADEFFT
ncbi:MAG TPA: type VI secretion system membrane subunit TssM, partial [Variovorax sp.]|nr:type VI secretion system membrane subunit TssM [Variovorax sp.]